MVRSASSPHWQGAGPGRRNLLPPRTLKFADDVFVGERGMALPGRAEGWAAVQYDQERESEYTLRVYWKTSMFERATVFW